MASEVSGRVEAENSGTTIEIKIKTMDSQTYTLQVDKQMPVPALKECIASVTGVVTDHQRLICRGKVLKDDQLLSAYHVEDGHTLHLVVREPTASSSQDLPADSGSDRFSTGNRGHVFQVAPGIVVETFNMPGQGDAGISDVSRIVSAVLGSMGITNPGISSETRNQGGNRHPGRSADTTQTSAVQSGIRSSNDRSRLQNAVGIPAGVSFGSIPTPVIPDALATLSQYLSRMRQEFLNSGNVGESNDGVSPIQGNVGASSFSAQSENTIPSPASLAELLSNTRRMLNQISEESILQLSRQLQDQENLTDPVARANAQSGAVRSGILLQNMGAFFLELGRTVMTLRLGQSPSEAVVNAGPAVYISSSGPNPLMVQALPFQPGASFGTPLPENLQAGSGLSNGGNDGFASRRIDIQIHRVSPSTPQTEPAGSQQSSGQRHSSPMVLGVTRSVQPTLGTSDSPSSNSGTGAPVNRSPEPGSLGFLYQLLGRNPNPASGSSSSRLESQVPTNMQAPESAAFQPNVEDPAGTGRATVTSSGQREPVTSRTIEVDIVSSGGNPSDLNADGQMSSGVLQFLRGIFPGGEFHVENLGTDITATETTQQAPPSDAVTAEADSRVTEEGLILSSMLQQIMPFISQDPEIARAVNAGDGDTSMQSDDPSSSAPVEGSQSRTSRRRDDDNPTNQDPKRQRME